MSISDGMYYGSGILTTTGANLEGYLSYGQPADYYTHWLQKTQPPVEPQRSGLTNPQQILLLEDL